MKKVVDFSSYYQKKDDNAAVVNDFSINNCGYYVSQIKKLSSRFIAKARRFPPNDFINMKLGEGRLIAWLIEIPKSSKTFALGSDGNIYRLLPGGFGEKYPMDDISESSSAGKINQKCIELAGIHGVLSDANFGSAADPSTTKLRKSPEKKEPDMDEPLLSRWWGFVRAYIYMFLILAAILGLFAIWMYFQFFPHYNV